MSSILEYELLKIDGTWIDRIKYVLSLSDKNNLEKYLKESFKTSYEDLKLFIFLSNLNKNEKNLLQIFQDDSLTIKQRIYAGKYWIKLQKDQQIIEDFIFQIINEKHFPKYLKYQILKSLHKMENLKKFPSFFYNLINRLTEKLNHEEYNLDAHLLTFCKKDQILNILSKWSIQRLEQINSSSIFYSKLIAYQPSIIIHLIKGDLNKYLNNSSKFSLYFKENAKVIELIAKKETKELICLIINYLNKLEKHKRFLPNLIELKQKYLFKKVPNEMIELITIVASNQPGSIKYQSSWGNDGSELNSFSFPRSFSIENFIRLFLNLYSTCHWSFNHTNQLLQYMLQNKNEYSNLSSIKKRRKWFFDIIVQKHFGEEIFFKKFLKEGNENTLQLLDEYSELTTPISIHLLSKFELHGIVKPEKHLSLIRYQLMTKQIFEQFLLLFKKTGSDVNQRQKNYPLLFQCALSTNEEYIKNVLQWIEKRFANEQIIVIEHFLNTLSSSNDYFHLKILPINIQSIESIIDIAINHLQQSTYTLQIIINYGIILLQRSEYNTNKQQIQTFATKIIKKCYSKNINISFPISKICECCPSTRDIIVDILICDIFPKLVSKCLINELNNILSLCNKKFWYVGKVDSFLEYFFTNCLLSSSKVQSSFQIDKHSSMISLYLKNTSTRFERVKQLINKIDKIFFIDKNVQRIVLHSQQYRTFIDQLIEDNKSVTLDKLSNEQSQFVTNLNSQTKNLKWPGLDIDLLKNCSQFLTGKEQEHIKNIILNDYLQDKEVSNLDKLKSFRVLRRLTNTYDEILQWIDEKQDSPLSLNNVDEISNSRGASVQPIDDIIICLPSTFDLTQKNFVKHLELLKRKLNAKNATFISDAMLNISRKIPDEIFLKIYFDFINNEQFQKLGITANKEIVRLLNEYVSDQSLVSMIIKPLWYNNPHQDIRVSIILTLLHFLVKSNLNDDQTIIWKILEEAADDEYLPVIQSLFAAHRGESRWPLTQLKNSSNKIFEIFVNRIQFKILDHPKSLQARSWAWTYLDYEYCHTKQLIEKAQQLCFQFDKNANTLWRNAFQIIISLFKLNQISSIDTIIDVINKIMLRREEIDSKENALDNQHDLPVYHRLQNLLIDLNSHINQFDNEKKIQFRSLTTIILQFDKTLSPLIGTLLIKISQNKEDLENVFNIFQQSLSENYFQRILTQFSTFIVQRDSCPFIQQLNIDEKLYLAQWFIQEKNRPLVVFELLKNYVFNQSGIDLELSRELLRQIRQNEDLYLRQQAMEYIVPWNEDGAINNENDDGDQISVSRESSNSDMS